VIPTPTYLQFHLVFSLPALAALWALAPRYEGVRRRRAAAGIAVLVGIAYAYTTPWIAYMIRRGAWSYADGAVLVRALSIPLGEYLFFTIQTLLVAFVLHRIGFDPTAREGDLDRRPRVAGVLVGLAALSGGLWLVSLDASFLYLGGLLAWVGPVIALQWAVGGGFLARAPRPWLAATLVPAAYLWVADRVAIGLGTWRIAPEFTTGVAVLGLPIEEACFFVAAGLMAANGLVLFEWLLDRNDRRIAAARERHGDAIDRTVGAIEPLEPLEPLESNESTGAGVDPADLESRR
jgi:lycopene cyclase domain-containing protein